MVKSSVPFDGSVLGRLERRDAGLRGIQAPTGGEAAPATGRQAAWNYLV